MTETAGSLRLVYPDRREQPLEDVLAADRERFAATLSTPLPRVCFAALRVVLRDDYGRVDPACQAPTPPTPPTEITPWIDWPATAALRRRVDALGFGVAEAMDTAQRFTIGWHNAERLIRLCGELDLRNGFVAGAGADDGSTIQRPHQLVDAVVAQARVIQECGGIPVLLPLPWLVEQGADEAGYVATYRAILAELEGPLLLHWLGEMFHPGLRGYFPGDSFVRIMALEPDKLRGAKLSLLDERFEIEVRRQLAARGQVVLTGDDLHFSDLLRGSNAVETTVWWGEREVAVGDFSHALLGAFDAVAEPAGLALRALARGDEPSYRRCMAPAEQLSSWIFQQPTRFYKSGLAVHSWLRGDQSNPYLVEHEQRHRDLDHYVGLVQRAVCAGTLGVSEGVVARVEQLWQGVP